MAAAKPACILPSIESDFTKRSRKEYSIVHSLFVMRTSADKSVQWGVSVVLLSLHYKTFGDARRFFMTDREQYAADQFLRTNLRAAEFMQ